MRASSLAWSLLGLALPPIAALLLVPELLAALGAERFGLLSLVWALTALSGLLDLGIGRATTKLLSDQHGTADLAGARLTASAALQLTLISGLVGAVLVLATLALDLRAMLGIRQITPDEISAVTLMLALMVPLQAASATYRGIAEGLQQFRGISLVRMTLGSANFLAPWLVTHLSTDMCWITASLLAVRGLAFVAFALIAQRHLPRADDTGTKTSLQSRRGELLRAGGWLSVSAVVSPLLVQADRFAIAAVISTAAVTSYAVPFDIITQLLIIPSALATVALPSLSRQVAAGDRTAPGTLMRWTVRVAIMMGLVTLLVGWMLPQALALWLGSSLPPDAVEIGRWLCLGVWLNAIGAMFYTWLHAHGRFRHTATLHLAELPVYAALLLALLHSHGVVGAAIAWVLRVGADTLCLGWLSRKSLQDREP